MTVEYPALWTSVSHLSITGLRGHCGREDGETVGVRVLGAVLWSETVSSRHDKTWWTHRSCGCMHKTCTRVSRSIFQCGQDTGSRGQVSSWGDIAISWLLDKDSQFFRSYGLWHVVAHTLVYTSFTLTCIQAALTEFRRLQKESMWGECSEGQEEKQEGGDCQIHCKHLPLSLSFILCMCVYHTAF